jgi:peptidoglycan-associated lipoprotein
MAVVTVASLGCACHARPPATAPTHASVPPTVPARPPAPPPPPPSPASPPPRTLTPQEQFDRTSLVALNAEHPLADAFFDLNQSTLRDDARSALQQDASWLAKWPSTKIMVEGRCDERGTAEYNLALGDKRARQVTEYLENLGVNSSRGDGEPWQGIAVLFGERGIMLGAEPAGTLCDHGEVTPRREPFLTVKC